MVKLIKHNQRKLAEQIFNNTQNIKSYTLENSFSGKECSQVDYEGKNWLLDDWLTFKFSRLTEESPNHFCLYIHSNCWYEFTN